MLRFILSIFENLHGCYNSEYSITLLLLEITLIVIGLQSGFYERSIREWR